MTKETHHKGLARKAQKQLEAQRRRKRTRRMIALGAVLVVILLGAGFWLVGRPQPPAKAKPILRDKPYPMTIDKDAAYRATFDTSLGVIQAQLYPKEAPVTVNNFVNLANDDWFDGTIFHRVANDIDIIQGGDPTCSHDEPTCGSGGPGYQFQDEVDNGLEMRVGSLAMANAGPDTNGSQFFIVTGPAGTTLPPDYTIFGEVTAGLGVAKKIQAVPVGGPQGDSPLEKVDLRALSIVETK